MTTAIAQTSIPFFNYRGAFAAREDEFMEIIRDLVPQGLGQIETLAGPRPE